MMQTVSLASFGPYSITRNLGGSLLPLATPSIAPILSRSIAALSSTFTVTPLPASFFAALASTVGVQRLPAMFSRSRANTVASAPISPRAKPCANAFWSPDSSTTAQSWPLRGFGASFFGGW